MMRAGGHHKRKCGKNYLLRICDHWSHHAQRFLDRIKYLATLHQRYYTDKATAFIIHSIEHIHEVVLWYSVSSERLVTGVWG